MENKGETCIWPNTCDEGQTNKHAILFGVELRQVEFGCVFVFVFVFLEFGGCLLSPSFSRVNYAPKFCQNFTLHHLFRIVSISILYFRSSLIAALSSISCSIK